MRVRIEYYAVLREQRGLGEEEIELASGDAATLYELLRARHQLKLGRENLKLAVNDEFAPWERKLVDGDRLVFIPPVAGG